MTGAQLQFSHLRLRARTRFPPEPPGTISCIARCASGPLSLFCGSALSERKDQIEKGDIP